MVNADEYVLQCALAKDYGPICYRLRAGYDLTGDEREFLASFLEGKRGGKGKGSTPRKAWEARRHYRLFYWLTQVEGDQPDHAYDRLSEIHGISRRTAISAVKEARETGHAAQIESQERALKGMLEGEFEDDVSIKAKLVQIYQERREAVLRGYYQDPLMTQVQE